jgi:hypothetical protein
MPFTCHSLSEGRFPYGVAKIGILAFQQGINNQFLPENIPAATIFQPYVHPISP